MGYSSFLMDVPKIALSYGGGICVGASLVGWASACDGPGSGIVSHDQGDRATPVVTAARAAGAAPGGRDGESGSAAWAARPGGASPAVRAVWGRRRGRDVPTSGAGVLDSPLIESSPAWPRDGKPLSAAVGDCRRLSAAVGGGRQERTATGGAAPSRDLQNLRRVVGGCGLAR
jgi:hypothetical protein